MMPGSFGPAAWSMPATVLRHLGWRELEAHRYAIGGGRRLCRNRESELDLVAREAHALGVGGELRVEAEHALVEDAAFALADGDEVADVRDAAGCGWASGEIEGHGDGDRDDAGAVPLAGAAYPGDAAVEHRIGDVPAGAPVAVEVAEVFGDAGLGARGGEVVGGLLAAAGQQEEGGGEQGQASGGGGHRRLRGPGWRGCGDTPMNAAHQPARILHAAHGPDNMQHASIAIPPDQAPAAAGAKPELRVVLAGPRGFCAGVDRAIRVVEEALRRYGSPVYVRHEIVHNRTVVEELEAQGAVFVEELDEVPADAHVVFSAHGVPKSVPAEAERRNLLYLDATCPLVSKVHREAERHFAAGGPGQRHILMIGHAGHPEVVGTMGQLPPGSMTLVQSVADAETVQPAAAEKLAFITQTTLSVDDTAEIVDTLRRRFPSIEGPKREDICYATTNRQAAVKAVAPECDLVVVIGSPNSSNSQRLREVAERAGAARAVLLPKAEQMDWAMMEGVRTLGLTAGASAPESLVQELLRALGERYTLLIEERRVTQEDVVFRLPAPLEARQHA